MADKSQEKLALVARKPSFGLPTACPIASQFTSTSNSPTSPSICASMEFIPIPIKSLMVEAGTYVAYNNEKSGVIEGLKEDGIVDLDSSVQTIPEWVSMKAMVETWLKEAAVYELWLGVEGKSAQQIYYSDLPWPVGKILHLKHVYSMKQLLGITKENSDKREIEIYGRANAAYKALSTLLGGNLNTKEQAFTVQQSCQVHGET